MGIERRRWSGDHGMEGHGGTNSLVTRGNAIFTCFHFPEPSQFYVSIILLFL